MRLKHQTFREISQKSSPIDARSIATAKKISVNVITSYSEHFSNQKDSFTSCRWRRNLPLFRHKFQCICIASESCYTSMRMIRVLAPRSHEALAPPVTPGGQTRGCPSLFETQQELTSGLLHNHLNKTMSTQRIIKRQTDIYF